MRRAVAPWAALAVAVVVVVAGTPAAVAAKKPVQVPGSVNVKGSKDVSGVASATLDVTLDDFVISPTFTKATPGQAIAVTVTNAGSTTHTFTSKALAVDVELSPGSSRTIDLTVPDRKGAFLLYCRFHRSSGMEGAVYTARGAKATDKPVAP